MHLNSPTDEMIAGHKDGKQGTLYVVSTPIGNLEDMTLRALKVLKKVDLIAAEGVQHTRKLCRHYHIQTKLISFHQHNQKARVPRILIQLKSGVDVALVTNAGTPGVSDPGVLLIRRALEEHIRVSPISGVSAVTAAISVSGMRADRFLFLGFLPSKAGKRKRCLQSLVNEPYTLVFFEAPHRLEAMLSNTADILGDRPMVLLRELTKIYEEVITGTARSVLEKVRKRAIQGEITLVIEGAESEKSGDLDEAVKGKLEKLLKDRTMSIKDIARKVAREEGRNYRHVYRECLSLERQMSIS